MRSPFCQVIIKENNRDITDFLSKFTFEDCINEDDMLVLSIFDTRIAVVDDKDLQEGKEIIFQFGYKGGELSPKYSARISDVEYNYGKQLDITIKATSVAILMKKNESSRVWENKTASEIAEAIAAKYGLEPKVDKTTFKHKMLPQGNRTDFELLKYLSNIEENGSYRFYVKNKTLFFTKMNLKKSSYKTYTWNYGDGTMVYFKPKSNETTKSGASRNLDVLTIDPKGGDFLKAKIDNKTSKDDTKLGDYPAFYNADRTQVDQKPSEVQKQSEDTDTAGKKILTPSGNQQEIDNIGNKKKKKDSLNDLEADLLIEGEPNLLADQIITIANVAKKHAGNWFVNKVIHNIVPKNNYLSKVDLKKNGVNSVKGNSEAQNTKSSNSNNSTGPDNTSDKKPLKAVKINANGMEEK